MLKVATGLSSPVPIHQGEEGAATMVAVEGTWFNSETSPFGAHTDSVAFHILHSSVRLTNIWAVLTIFFQRSISEFADGGGAGGSSYGGGCHPGTYVTIAGTYALFIT